MDNKQVINWLKLAVPIRALTREDFEKFIISVNMAMNSLEAWDKVKEDIKHSQFIFLSGDKEIECIPIFEVMNIVNKHLKEIKK